MEIIKYAQVFIFVFTIASSELALANCPGAMPEQLMEDCIVYEGAGSSFPTSDYAHMEQYQDWMKTQQSPAITQPTTAATPIIK